MVAVSNDWVSVEVAGLSHANHSAKLEQMVRRGMDRRAAERALTNHADNLLRDIVGSKAIADIRFVEFSDGSWAPQYLDSKGALIVAGGAGHWGGQAPPEPTGRTFLFSEMDRNEEPLRHG